MRISDWSSDVCSSDLDRRLAEQAEQAHEIGEGAAAADIITDHHLSMFARGLGIDLRRLFGRTRQVAIGEFMEERAAHRARRAVLRSEEHTSELQSLMRISYVVFCLEKQKYRHHIPNANLVICLLL